MRIAPETLNEVIPKFMKDGWQVVRPPPIDPATQSLELTTHQNVHAIGDRANGVVLDAFEAALAEANVTALRPRLEHAQILAQKDIARFGDLGGTSAPLPYPVLTNDHARAVVNDAPERVQALDALGALRK